MRRAAMGLILVGAGCSDPPAPYYYAEGTAGQTSRAPIDATPRSSGSSTLTTDAGSGDGAAPNSGLPFRFCERIGATPVARLGVLLRIAQDYDAARNANCRTTGLLEPVDDDQRDQWWDYLLNYSNALAGCPLVVTPLPGGIDAFGPANTSAIGIEHPFLTELAAELLIEQYMAAFTIGFELAAPDASLVEAHLRDAAAAQIRPEASDWTSRCGLDAGRADSGVADAGVADGGNP